MTTDSQQEILLEQYKLYVQLADNVSARRIDAGKFYITLLSALLAVIPFAVDQNTPPGIRRLVFLLIGFLGVVLCVIWIVNIRSYKQLNALKFQVIQEMEQQLPFASYAREWEILDEERERFSYRRLSKVEQYVPALLIIPYVILLLLSLFG